MPGILSDTVDEGLSLARPMVPLGVPGTASPMVFPKPAIRKPLNLDVKKLSPGSLSIRDIRGDAAINYLMNRFHVGDQNIPYTNLAMTFGPKKPSMMNLGLYGYSLGLGRGIDRLAGVKDSLYYMLPRLNPNVLAFTAGSRNLEPLYDRVSSRLAKEFGGELSHSRTDGLKNYDIKFPKAPERGSDPTLNALFDKFFGRQGSF